jgi:leader peptidase (prepilin peptidase)/N-methyltransferase
MTGDPLLAAVGGLFGLLFGSFLNVCIGRWPSGQSVVRPRSRCPKCGVGIAARDNIPVVSWLLLRGKCRKCGNPISTMYPAVELVTAVIWAWCVWHWGVGAEALKWALFATILLGIAMTDAREFIIPHEFSFGGLAIGVVFGFLGGLGTGFSAINGDIFGAGLVYLIGMLGEFAFRKEQWVAATSPPMAMVGSFLGWQSVVVTIFAGAAVGGGAACRCAGVRTVRRSDGRRNLRRRQCTDRPTVRPSDRRSHPRRAPCSGYLPSGVSLAIAAGLIALVTRPQSIIDWFANYATLWDVRMRSRAALFLLTALPLTVYRRGLPWHAKVGGTTAEEIRRRRQPAAGGRAGGRPALQDPAAVPARHPRPGA